MDVRTLTAYHESGHALAHYVLGLTFFDVSIIAGVGSLGHISQDCYCADELAVDEVESHVVALLAGMAAEMRYTGRADWQLGGSTDFVQAFELVVNSSTF